MALSTIDHPWHLKRKPPQFEHVLRHPAQRFDVTSVSKTNYLVIPAGLGTGNRGVKLHTRFLLCVGGADPGGPGFTSRAPLKIFVPLEICGKCKCVHVNVFFKPGMVQGGCTHGDQTMDLPCVVPGTDEQSRAQQKGIGHLSLRPFTEAMTREVSGSCWK